MLFANANPIAMGIVVAGWAITQIGLMLRYTAHSTTGVKASRERDPLSILYFLIMSAALGFAFWGPIDVRSGVLDESAKIEIGIVAALVALGEAFFVSGIVVLGRNFAAAAQVRDEGHLVTGGPYAIVRNPIYLGYFLILLATPLAFGHPQSLLIAVPLYLVGGVLRILREEKVLRAHFGAAYDNYAARTKRLIPFIW